MKNAPWRGDLLRVLSAGGDEAAVERTAKHFGLYVDPAAAPRAETAVEPDTPAPDSSPASGGETRIPPKPAFRPFDLALPAPLRFEPTSEREDEPPSRSGRSAADVRAAATDDRRYDPWTPLLPWPMLYRRLRSSCAEARPTREIDVVAVVRRLGRGEIGGRPSYRARKAVAARFWLLLDLRGDLEPYRRDFFDVARRCARMVAPEALTVWALCGGSTRTAVRFDPIAGRDMNQSARRLPRPSGGEKVLALSDLGAYEGAARIAEWTRLGIWLRESGAVLRAWTPCSTGRLEKRVARLWSAVPLEELAVGRDEAAEAESAFDHDAIDRAGARRLAALLSPALDVDADLVRFARRIEGFHRCGIGAERALWVREDFDGYAGARARAGALSLRRDGPWADEGEASATLRRLVADVLWRSRIGDRCEHLRCIEALQCAQFDAAAVPAERLRDAVARLSRLIAELRSAPVDADGGAHPFLLDREVERAGALLRHPDLKRAFAEAVVRHDVDDGAVAAAAGLTPDQIERAGGPPHQKTPWTMFLSSDGLVLEPGNVVGSPARPDRFPIWRGKLGNVAHVRRTAEKPRQWRLPAEAAVAQPPSDTFAFDAFGGSWEFGPLVKPPWASTFGRDAYGIYADFVVGPRKVRQRMRWIPPGRFWMGSPEEETRGFKEHDDWKVRERRHLVAITKGYWLADTPCTQELWLALNPSNPSRFPTRERPVENVNWKEADLFTGALTVAVARERAAPGKWIPPAPEDGGFRLPTEAEWEYACRAGTETATYAGDLVVKGENDAPLLHQIGWYGGNCGHELDDIPEPYDISSWPERQFNDLKNGATHRVKGRPANPLGLYDMIGNVWEWCMDWFAEYDVPSNAEIVRDPTGPMTTNDRVVRGGSWYSYARACRAAYRHWWSPDKSRYTLGFRLARGPWPSSSPEGGTAERREAERAERPGRRAKTSEDKGAPSLKSTTTKTVVRKPLLTITIGGPEKRFIGRPIEYEIIVNNLGDGVAKGAVCEAMLPEGVSFVSATDGGVNAAGKITWNLGDMAPKASRTVRATVTSADGGILKNEAVARAYGVSTVNAECSTVVEGVPALLLEVIGLQTAIEVGAEVTYEIAVTNQGSAPGTNIGVKVTLDDSMKFVSAGGATNATSNVTAAQGGSFSYAPLASLAPKAKATWILKIKALKADDARLAASMTAAGFTRPYDTTAATQFY